MDGFNGILDSFQEEDLQMILDKSIRQGKKLLVDLKGNQSKRLKILVVNLMIIQSHLK